MGAPAPLGPLEEALQPDDDPPDPIVVEARLPAHRPEGVVQEEAQARLGGVGDTPVQPDQGVAGPGDAAAVDQGEGQGQHASPPADLRDRRTIGLQEGEVGVDRDPGEPGLGPCPGHGMGQVPDDIGVAGPQQGVPSLVAPRPQ